MKIVKLIFALLAILFAGAQTVNLVLNLISGAETAYQVSRIGGSVAGICLGAAIATIILKSIFASSEKVITTNEG